MARNKQENVDVETVETDEVDTPEASTEAAPKAKGPTRGTLPEGYVTPVGFAKVLGERGLQKNRSGEVQTEVKPQMVYSYMRNAPKDDPFPVQEIEDDKGVKRQALKVEDGIAWWERKNARTAQRSENAAAKAAKKAASAEKGEASEAEDAGEAVEAE